MVIPVKLHAHIDLVSEDSDDHKCRILVRTQLKSYSRGGLPLVLSRYATSHSDLPVRLRRVQQLVGYRV